MIPFPPDRTPVHAFMGAYRREGEQIEALQKRYVRDFQLLTARFHALEEVRRASKQAPMPGATPGMDIYRTRKAELEAEERMLDDTRRNLAHRIMLYQRKGDFLDAMHTFTKTRMDELLVRKPALRFRQMAYLPRTSEGRCSAFCIEYAHWRRAGLDAGRALAKLRSPEAGGRIRATQKELRSRYFAHVDPGAPAKLQPVLATQAYVLAFADHAERLRSVAWPLAAPASTYPAVPPASLTVCSSIVPTFSVAAFAWMWPAWLPRPWSSDAPLSTGKPGQAHVVRLAGGNADLVAMAPGQRHALASSSAIPEFPHEDKKQVPPPATAHAGAGIALSTTDLQELVRQTTDWQSDVQQALRDIVRRHGPCHVIPCFLACKSWGHFVTLDLDPQMPGLFDPNHGFFTLRSPYLHDHFLSWMLALIVYLYDVYRIDFMHVPLPVQGEMTSGLPRAPALVRSQSF